jgi:hypothetical protein
MIARFDRKRRMGLGFAAAGAVLSLVASLLGSPAQAAAAYTILDRTCHGTLEASDYVDVAVPLRRGERVVVWGDRTSPSGDLDVYVVDPSGAVVARDDQRHPDAYVSARARRDADYRIRFRNGDDRPGFDVSYRARIVVVSE